MEKRKRRRSNRAGRPAMRSPGRPRGAGRAEPHRFWKAIARGLSSEEAAVSCGVSPPVGGRWFREGGGWRRSAWRRRRLVPCPVRSGGRSQSYARRAPGCATWPVGFVEPRRLSHEHGVATRRLDAAVWRIGRRLRRGTAPDVPSGRREPSWPRPIACGAPCRTASQARSGLRTGGPCLAQT